jgi:signal transduction histidine kinase/ligand-binding sensor domain-containing protein
MLDARKKILRILWICVGSAHLCSPIHALDPNQPLSQLYHTSWTTKDGLNGAVLAIVQATDGYLWLGTTNGLYRFDGLRFEFYKPEIGTFPSSSIRSLLASADGSLWIGYMSGGVTHLKDGVVTNYSPRDGLPVSQVRRLAQDQDGTIWAAIVGGFARLEGKHWHKVRMDWNYPAKSAWSVFVDRQGTLWVASGDRILFLPKGEKKFQDTGLRTTGRVWAFAQAADGTIWFSDDDQNSLRAVRYPLVKEGDGLTSIGVAGRGFLFDRDGSIWLAGDGVQRVPYPKRFRGAEVPAANSGEETLMEKQGITGDIGEAVFEDREGNIWVGTDGGLDRFRYRNLSWYPAHAGSRLFNLVARENGAIWAFDSDGVVVNIQNGHGTKTGMNEVRGAFSDSDGTIWITSGDKTWRWASGRFVKIAPPEHVARIGLGSETKDRSGTVWVSIGGSGEFQLRDGVWKFTAILKDHPDYTAMSAHTDAADRIWLAYPEVIAQWDHGNVRVFSSEDGLTNGHFTIIAGRDQQVWVGGESGLALFQGNHFQTLTGTDGNNFGSITGIVATSHDGLWLSAGPGIVHIPQSEIERISLHSDSKVHYEIFDLLSDLPEPLQVPIVGFSNLVQGTDGMLWFATHHGFARIDPTRIVKNTLPPPVSIRAVVADDKPYSVLGRATLPPLTKNLQIDYTALSLSIPERVRFRYKLEGADENWQDVGTRRQAFYRDLRPGGYRFHVIACNNDGVWNETGATLDFSVAPAWYQTDWFRLLCFLVAAFIVWGLYQLRVRQIAAGINARFDERLAERTRLAGELHDTLLQTIQSSKLIADDALDQPSDVVRLRAAMQRLSEWLGQATQEGRAAVRSLRTSTTPMNDLVAGLRRVTEDRCTEGSMQTAFSVTGGVREMHPIARDEVYHIAYEAIRNACVHSGGNRLEVELIYARDLTVRVKDNGVGINKAVAEKGREGHFGLQGMRERAARIGATLTLVSSAISGTEVTVHIPERIAFLRRHDIH